MNLLITYMALSAWCLVLGAWCLWARVKLKKSDTPPEKGHGPIPRGEDRAVRVFLQVWEEACKNYFCQAETTGHAVVGVVLPGPPGGVGTLLT